MATTTTKKRDIKYLNRDFESFKRDFIEHLRIYFPDTVQDFNESSSGMLLLELAAFMGDNLSFYLDRRFQETFTETAREAKNLFKHAKQLGFKTFGKTAATGELDAFLKIPATTVNSVLVPDVNYAGITKRGAKLKSKTGVSFETTADVDFSTVDITNNLFVQPGDLDPTTNSPVNFVLRKPETPVKAGETKSATFAVGGYQAFRKITLSDKDVIEIISMTDSEGNDWFEVDFLAQDTIFSSVANAGDDATEVPFVLKLKSVPFRFVSEYDVATNKTALIFGTGDAQEFDGDLIPDLGDISLPLFGKDAFSELFLDPQNFLKVKTLGLAPTNTTLTISYRVGGGEETNVGSQELDTVVESVFDVGDSTLNAATVKDVANSFEVLNFNPIQGGKEQLTNDEIRQLIAAHFATQNRMVTTPDFVVRALSMPAKFGSVFRANAKVSALNKNAVELVVLSKDSSGIVTIAPSDLKENLKKYLGRFRMMTDAIEILDGEIINLSIDFDILSSPDVNNSEVLANCIDALKEFFEIDKWQINQPINQTDIITLLAGVPGVLSVARLTFKNNVSIEDGRQYSTTSHNFKKNTQNGIIYSKENAIFEVKFPNKDITGLVK